MSIRKTLFFAAIILTLVPLLLFIYYENGQIDKQTISEHKSNFISFSRTAGEAMIKNTQYIYSQIWLASREFLNKDDLRETLADDEEADRISRLLLNTIHSIGTADSGASKVSDLMLLDLNGDILASSNKEIAGQNIKGTSLFEMLTAGELSSPFTESEFRDGEYGLWLTRRFNDDLFLSAFVSSDVYFLSDIFGKTGAYTIISQQGIIISHPNKLFIGMTVDEQIINELESYKQQTNSPRTGSGQGMVLGHEQVYGYYMIDELGGAVYVFQQKDEVLALKTIFIRDSLIFALLFGILSLLVFMILIHRRIIRPILVLKKSFIQAYEGKYENCEIRRTDEIGELVRGFNRLVDQISGHIAKLEQSNLILRNMEERLEYDREKLRLSENRFMRATDISTIAIFELTPYTNEYFHSDSWSRITTYTHGEFYPLEYVLHNIIHPDYRAKLINWFDKLTGAYEGDLKFFTSDKKVKWIHISMAVIEDEIAGVKVAGTLTDINDRMKAQEYSDYLAYHEPLTGFPRLNMFCEDVTKKINHLKKGQCGLVISLNIANIRRINDTYGFAIGDKIIVIIAEALKKNFGNTMYYSRNSGDSFMLYTECTEDVEYVDDLFRRILYIFRKPLLVSNMSVAVDIRIGASVYPLHGYQIEELIQYADIAMIEAWLGRDAEFAMFDPVMMAKIRRTHQIMQILQEFEENKVLRVVYQPIVDINKKCLGFEALVRLDVTHIGFISPAEFIPLAEDARLIIPIGREILRSACAKTVELFAEGYEFEYMSVNVSPIQLADGAFVEMVYSVLNETGLPYEKLQLEVTESIMLSNIELTCEKLAVLRESGIRIALDDFGTGYSSMMYLRMIPLDVLKIDKHFIDELESEDEQIFALTMIQLSHALGLKVVAEGVETKNQFDILKDNKCDCIQGYFVSRPLNEEGMQEFLKNN